MIKKVIFGILLVTQCVLSSSREATPAWKSARKVVLNENLAKRHEDVSGPITRSRIENLFDYDHQPNAILYNESSGEVNIYRQGGLFNMFLYAYNNHKSVYVTPDDIWMTITMMLSDKINKNPERFRNKFVDFEGKKTLHVETGQGESESDWGEFFDLMIEEIKNNVKGTTVDDLKSDYSTTSRLKQVISISVVMNTFKSYFVYSRGMPVCGLADVYFGGSDQDWIRLIGKFDRLTKLLSDDDGWQDYARKLLPVLNQFLNTYRGKVDKEFWDKMINEKYGRHGSGSTTSYSGWLLAFYDMYMEGGSVDQAPLKQAVSVEINLFNRATGIQKELLLRSGSIGLNIEEDVVQMVYGIAIGEMKAYPIVRKLEDNCNVREGCKCAPGSCGSACDKFDCEKGVYRDADGNVLPGKWVGPEFVCDEVYPCGADGCIESDISAQSHWVEDKVLKVPEGTKEEQKKACEEYMHGVYNEADQTCHFASQYRVGEDRIHSCKETATCGGVGTPGDEPANRGAGLTDYEHESFERSLPSDDSELDDEEII